MAEIIVVFGDRIVVDPAVMAGKPTVRGTRIPVESVLKHFAQQPDLEDLLAAYPRLTVEDVKACLAYAHALVESQSHRKSEKPHPQVA